MWKRTYVYYNKEQADRVFKDLKMQGTRVKMTRRKADIYEKKRHNSNYIYSIYRWRT